MANKAWLSGAGCINPVLQNATLPAVLVNVISGL